MFCLQTERNDEDVCAGGCRCLRLPLPGGATGYTGRVRPDVQQIQARYGTGYTGRVHRMGTGYARWAQGIQDGFDQMCSKYRPGMVQGTQEGYRVGTGYA